jgi:adenylosuccinate synthase
VIGVTKAYCTRVGGGPFPSEIEGPIAEQLRARGNEYGAVTGRPRRCGWVDLPLLRYAQMINGVNWWVVTKMDVLDPLDEIPVCVAYKMKGRKFDCIPALATGFDQVECVYEKMPGWKKSTEGVTSFDDLPKKAQEYLRFLERESGARIGMVSTGPDRDQTMLLPDFAAEILSSAEKSLPQKGVKAK